MEANQNQSKLSVLFGDEIGSNEQSSFHLELSVSKLRAQTQAAKIKQLINNQVETSTSLTIVFSCLEANQEKLIELLETVFNGTSQNYLAKNIRPHVVEGRIAHNIIRSQDKLILVIRPIGDMSDMISGQVGFVMSAEGFKELVESQQNNVVLDIKSVNTFAEIEESMQGGDSFIGALLKSLKLNLTLNIHQDLLMSIVEILEAIDPVFASSPISFLQFFKSFNIDVKFASAQELPDSIRSDLMKNGRWKDGLSVKEDSLEENKRFWGSFAQLLEPGIEAYVNIEDFLALHVESNLPGFGAHFTRNIKEN